jgi:nucleoside-diphosphate-sugar epimerase
MRPTSGNKQIIGQDDPVLVTGANGFIGYRVVRRLLDRGFRNIRCFVRHSHNAPRVQLLCDEYCGSRIQIFTGNLLSPGDCAAATLDTSVIFHLAAGRAEKFYPDAFMNSVVSTRNLLDACRASSALQRFVNVSSFAVYSNTKKPAGNLLDESCPIEDRPERRGDAYTFAKVKQDELVMQYGKDFSLPYVIVRPGHVYGPGNEAITARVGIGTFGVFLHLGGPNTIPFTYVDNCADAIILAGLREGVEGEVFNVVDDDLPSSRKFLRMYKQQVGNFTSFYLPHAVSYGLCSLWEWYSDWSQGQLPPSFNRKRWHSFWKRTRYSNEKLRSRVGWIPQVSTEDGLQRYFEACRKKEHYA